MTTTTLKTFALASILVTACTEVQEDPAPQPEPAATCATTTCDPAATCTDTDAGPVCSCSAGFSGDGATCADVDECAGANTCAAGNACVNAAGGFDCLPTSCAGVLAAEPTADDGNYTLYVGGDPQKSWDAYCADMQAVSGPREYLTLVNVLGDHNFSSYEAGGASPGTTVKTMYLRLRIDPATLVVDIADQRFSISTGALSHSGAGPVISMPYGVAMSCGVLSGRANLDLRGTGFAIADTFATGGNAELALTNTSIDPAQQFVDLTGAGSCGWNAVSGASFNPFNTAPGTLRLSYAE